MGGFTADLSRLIFFFKGTDCVGVKGYEKFVLMSSSIPGSSFLRGKDVLQFWFSVSISAWETERQLLLESAMMLLLFIMPDSAASCVWQRTLMKNSAKCLPSLRSLLSPKCSRVAQYGNERSKSEPTHFHPFTEHSILHCSFSSIKMFISLFSKSRVIFKHRSVLCFVILMLIFSQGNGDPYMHLWLREQMHNVFTI